VIDGSLELVEAAFEPVAGAVDGEDFAVVEKPVDDRGREDFVAEGVGPLGDCLVAGDDRRRSGVAAVDDLEEPVRVAGAADSQ
jgi:hypothetical protein